ncbi:ABC transporter ATP-binding protein [Actinomadura rudentiformis]|uniref:ABC transporter ATP-binding protein n=1 Tax=Actinomadura rudentiformis TaxID=359158 RepID=A0A6H9YMV3_9ACTN|nr:ABC transporter ATP-binding protein [Actinomadura rudentiformis]KAB2340126.1 ABC transporter ATP-binding protein [Actinomadura rudentiformis]
MSDGAAVRACGLTKRFGGLTALDGLELSVERGEVFGYLGPNGAGKTTTIRLLLGFLFPSSGRSEVLDGPGSDPAIRARIGYLPADLKVPPGYTTNDLIGFYGRLRGGHDPEWVGDLLDRFDLDPGRRIGELSTGNRRKVGVVAAVAHRPELLILDEPTSGLDPLLQHQFQLLVRELAADGATVFLSSHVLPEVELLARRVAILRQGRLMTISTIDDLRRQARQRLDLHLSRAPDAPEEFRRLPGVVEATVAGRTLRLVVDGSVAEVVRAAARLGVERIVTHEADLDEVFLRYYQEERS